MPTTPLDPLSAIYAVRDPVQVLFQDPDNLASDNEDPTELELQVEVEETYGSGAYARVGEFLNPYSSADTAAALINRPLLGSLKASPPDLTLSGWQPYVGIVKRFRLRARDLVGGAATVGFEISNPAHAWLAGKDYRSQGADTLIGKAYLFLSTKPLDRRYHPSERIILFLLPLVNGPYVLRARRFFTDGSDSMDESHSLGLIPAFRPWYLVYDIPVLPAKQISRIEFDMVGPAGTKEMLIYRPIAKPGPYFKQLIYLNSLGGFDSVALMGKSEESHTDSGEVFESLPFPSTATQEGNFQTFNQKQFQSFVLRTGWITLPERRALMDLTLRNEAYLVEGTSQRKILITNASYITRRDGEFLYAMEFQARFAHDNHALSRP